MNPAVAPPETDDAGDDGDQQRHPHAEQGSRQQIAAQLVGPEEMHVLERRRSKSGVEVGRDIGVRDDERQNERKRRDQHQDKRAARDHAAFAQLPHQR